MLDDLKEEEIVNKVGGRFKLSTIIQKRMVALNTGAPPLVDVRSGRWAMCASQSFDDLAHSARFNREASDQKQVEKLKQLAYASAAEDVVKIYAR